MRKSFGEIGRFIDSEATNGVCIFSTDKFEEPYDIMMGVANYLLKVELEADI